MTSLGKLQSDPHSCCKARSDLPVQEAPQLRIVFPVVEVATVNDPKSTDISTTFMSGAAVPKTLASVAAVSVCAAPLGKMRSLFERVRLSFYSSQGRANYPPVWRGARLVTAGAWLCPRRARHLRWAESSTSTKRQIIDAVLQVERSSAFADSKGGLYKDRITAQKGRTKSGPGVKIRLQPRRISATAADRISSEAYNARQHHRP